MWTERVSEFPWTHRGFWRGWDIWVGIGRVSSPDGGQGGHAIWGQRTVWTKARAGTGLTLEGEGWGAVWDAKARASWVLGAGVEWGCAGSTLGHEVWRGDLGLTARLACGTGEPWKDVDWDSDSGNLFGDNAGCWIRSPKAHSRHSCWVPTMPLPTLGGSRSTMAALGVVGSQGHSPPRDSTVYSPGAGKDHV